MTKPTSFDELEAEIIRYAELNVKTVAETKAELLARLENVKKDQLNATLISISQQLNDIDRRLSKLEPEVNVVDLDE